MSSRRATAGFPPSTSAWRVLRGGRPGRRCRAARAASATASSPRSAGSAAGSAARRPPTSGGSADGVEVGGVCVASSWPASRGRRSTRRGRTRRPVPSVTGAPPARAPQPLLAEIFVDRVSPCALVRHREVGTRSSPADRKSPAISAEPAADRVQDVEDVAPGSGPEALGRPALVPRPGRGNRACTSSIPNGLPVVEQCVDPRGGGNGGEHVVGDHAAEAVPDDYVRAGLLRACLQHVERTRSDVTADLEGLPGFAG